MNALDLIDQIRRGPGDGAAKDELYRQSREALLERLRQRIPARLRKRLDAEDVLHTAFLRAIDSLDDFQATSDRSFFAWLFTIAKNLITDAGKRRSAMSLPLTQGEDQSGPRASQLFERKRGVATEFSGQEFVESTLNQLKEKEAEVIRLRLLEGFSFEEIAKRWEKTPGAVQRFYSRACQRLRELGVADDTLFGP